MGSISKIEWTDATWNPITGCSRVSEGCRHCYAERFAHRFSGPGQRYEGLTVLANGHPQWTGKIQFNEKALLAPLRWQKPRRIFVNSMSDLFHESVTDEQRDRIFAVMALCPQHIFQVLTKRPERMLRYLSTGPHASVNLREPFIGRAALEIHVQRGAGPLLKWAGLPLPNVWLGVSVENQPAADERIPLLLETPAAARFISAEPLLGPLDLREYTGYGKYAGNIPGECVNIDGETWHREDEKCRTCGWGFPDDPDFPRRVPGLDWVICGGESGPRARPMHPAWARSLRDQCVAADVPFFFKQWGEYWPISQMPDGWLDRDENERLRGRGEVLQLNGEIEFAFPEGAMTCYPVGKKAAGALLDGRPWRQMPEVHR